MGNLSRQRRGLVADVISASGAGNATCCALEEALLHSGCRLMVVR